LCVGYSYINLFFTQTLTIFVRYSKLRLYKRGGMPVDDYDNIKLETEEDIDNVYKEIIDCEDEDEFEDFYYQAYQDRKLCEEYYVESDE